MFPFSFAHWTVTTNWQEDIGAEIGLDSDFKDKDTEVEEDEIICPNL